MQSDQLFLPTEKKKKKRKVTKYDTQLSNLNRAGLNVLFVSERLAKMPFLFLRRHQTSTMYHEIHLVDSAHVIIVKVRTLVSPRS